MKRLFLVLTLLTACFTASYAQADSFFVSPTYDASTDIRSAVAAKYEELVLNKSDANTWKKELINYQKLMNTNNV